MGGRLTTPPSSASSSSATAHRTLGTTTSNNLPHTRTHSNSTSHTYQHQPAGYHRHRSNSGHPSYSSSNHRHRTTSTNLDPIGTTAFNLNLLRYVGFEHESDDQSSEDDSPRAHRRLQHFIIALRDVACPVCNKTIPHDSFDKHILQCLSKPRIDYNGLLNRDDLQISFLLVVFFLEDTLTEDKGECVICLDDLLVGQKIARLPCLCIYHKR